MGADFMASFILMWVADDLCHECAPCNQPKKRHPKTK